MTDSPADDRADASGACTAERARVVIDVSLVARTRQRTAGRELRLRRPREQRTNRASTRTRSSASCAGRRASGRDRGRSRGGHGAQCGRGFRVGSGGLTTKRTQHPRRRSASLRRSRPARARTDRGKRRDRACRSGASPWRVSTPTDQTIRRAPRRRPGRRRPVLSSTWASASLPIPRNATRSAPCYAAPRDLGHLRSLGLSSEPVSGRRRAAPGRRRKREWSDRDPQTMSPPVIPSSASPCDQSPERAKGSGTGSRCGASNRR